MNEHPKVKEAAPTKPDNPHIYEVAVKFLACDNELADAFNGLQNFVDNAVESIEELEMKVKITRGDNGVRD
jgi:hypothetical protein